MPKHGSVNHTTLKKMQCNSNRQVRDLTFLVNQQQEAFLKMKEQMEAQLSAQQEEFNQILKEFEKQHEVLANFNKEYRALKKRLGRDHLMRLIRLREDLVEDMKEYEKYNKTDLKGYKYTEAHVEELTEILEDQGVELITGVPGMAFNKEEHVALDIIPVHRQEQNELIYKVFKCGYRWAGIPLKKMEVVVCVYR